MTIWPNIISHLRRHDLSVIQYARIIQKLGFPARFKDFKIKNIVGSCDVKFPIRLEGLAYFPSDLKDFKVNHCSALLTVYLKFVDLYCLQKLCCSFLYLEKLLSQELRSEMKPTQHLRTYTLSLQSSGRSNSDSVMMICI
ncbi:hypothetical protein Q3G72_021748 [Acer saccharum]|nr:hypothetical protein Q3G72_021748 [Acer saccharum]